MSLDVGYSIIVLYLGTRYGICECNSLRDMTTNVFVYIKSMTQKVGHNFSLYKNIHDPKSGYYPGSKYRCMSRVNLCSHIQDFTSEKQFSNFKIKLPIGNIAWFRFLL